MNLIQRLNAAFAENSDPDAIVAVVSDPFSEWRRCSSLTEAEYEQHSGLHIVLLHFSHFDRKNFKYAERYHRLGWSNDLPYENDEGDEYEETDTREDHNGDSWWPYPQFAGDWLGTNFYFRSFAAHVKEFPEYADQDY